MIEQIRLLTKLQGIDLKIFSLDQERQRCIIRRDQLKSELSTVTARIERLKISCTDREKFQKKHEDEVATEKSNLKKWKARLNDSRNSRESVALVREIDLQEKSIKHMEDDIIKFMEEVEELKKDIASDIAAAEEISANLKIEEQKVVDTISAVDAKVAEYASLRNEYIRQINPASLKHYNFIRSKRNGQAVCSVSNGICSGCHMFISPQLLTQLYVASTMETCPSCQRIIYIDELLVEESQSADNP